jgi:spermidine synthase
VILSAGMFGGASDNLVYFHEDAQASVTVRRLLDNNEPYLSLELNGVNVAGTSPDLYAVQKMQGHLPLLLAKTPSKVAHIGFGSGGTAWAVSRHPSILDILIVEISPEVLAASDRTFPNINHGVLGDSRVRTEINDGRNFLLANDQVFDAILSDSIHPRYAGNGSLYSLEYFRLARERLAPGGVVSMWLPMYSLTPHNYAMILEAFRQVFPDMAVWYETSTLNSFTIVTGKTDPVPWYADTLERAFSSPDVTAEFADLRITGAADVLSYLVATGQDLDPWLRDVPPHVDDVPAVEYESGGLLVRNLPWYYTFQKLLELRPEDPPAEYLEVLPEEERRLARDRFRHQGSVMRRHLEALQKLAAQSDLGIDSAQPMP